MQYETILYEVADHIATVTLNRPDKLNAFNSQMAQELIDALDRIDADDNVRAVIFTGSGRAYCAGADLGKGAETFDISTLPGSPVRPDGSIDYSQPSARDPGGLLTLRIFRCLKPVIAAINGPAVGIGATMILPMDIRIASEEARIGFAFGRLGIVPEAASSYFLPRLVGISRALEWCYHGRLLSVAEVMAAGLVRSSFPTTGLIEAARTIAREIADHTAPVSIALIRQMLWRGLGMSDPMQAHQIDSRGLLSRGTSPDAAEGVSAFLQKRSPRFPDKVSSDMPDFFPWWTEEAFG